MNRFRVADPYPLFCFRFIQPALREIKTSGSQASLTRYIPRNKSDVWRRLALEYVYKEFKTWWPVETC